MFYTKIKNELVKKCSECICKDCFKRERGCGCDCTERIIKVVKKCYEFELNVIDNIK